VALEGLAAGVAAAGLAAGVTAALLAALAFLAAATFLAAFLGGDWSAFLFPLRHLDVSFRLTRSHVGERRRMYRVPGNPETSLTSQGVEPLVDSWDRQIRSVRVSVTDKCNFRCRYCMPAEGLEWLPRDELLSFEEIARLAGVLASMGVDEVRLTGGEPLVRRDLPMLVSLLAETPGVRDLSLTTNGVLLDRLAEPLVEAGLTRLNVSLDSLSHVRFAEITRRDALDRVLAGLAEAERYPELRPIKVNCVAIRGFTEEEVPALAELARRKPYVVRFIEFMPLDADEAWREDEVLTGGEIRALIEERWPLEEIPAKASSTARRFRFADGAGEIGFVNPVSEPFCSSCDRIRLTSDGQLRTCLFSRREWDLKAPLRDGASDDELAALIRFAVRHKELKHKINDPGFVRASRSMSQIGG
jgi:GTP 3',8-cyclase